MNVLKRKIIISFVGIMLLSGCGISELKFEKETETVENIEEILENRLEAENPEHDLDVTISTDTD
jgi:hypothetical protein